MEKMRARVEKELALLRGELQADVAAVAWQRKDDLRLVWWAASGCPDERYRSLAIRTGRGPEGSAPRIGRAVVIHGGDGSMERLRKESALMTVEGLQAAAAFPIATGSTVGGVLLVGYRSAHRYKEDQLRAIERCSQWLGEQSERIRAEEAVHHPI